MAALSVSRYFCLLLRGLSGMVISINPSSRRGFRTWCLNLVRSERPAIAIRSNNALSFWHLCRISTWCRLGSNFPGNFLGGFRGMQKNGPLTYDNLSKSLHTFPLALYHSLLSFKTSGLLWPLRKSSAFFILYPRCSDLHSLNCDPFTF